MYHKMTCTDACHTKMRHALLPYKSAEMGMDMEISILHNIRESELGTRDIIRPSRAIVPAATRVAREIVNGSRECRV